MFSQVQRFRAAAVGMIASAALLGAVVDPARAEGIRSQAIVDLSFDETSGIAVDTATAGVAKDNGTLVNNPGRISSPFWGQAGKQALVFDAAAKQYLRIPDSAD